MYACSNILQWELRRALPEFQLVFDLEVVQYGQGPLAVESFASM